MKKFKLTKDSLASMCAEAGLTPQARLIYRGYDIFIGHGFTAQPGVKFKRFGIDAGMFPFGAFATLWSIAKGENCVLIANINPYVDGREKDARLCEAVTEAKLFIDEIKSEQGKHVYH